MTYLLMNLRPRRQSTGANMASHVSNVAGEESFTTIKYRVKRVTDP